ncbi:hypothetical protein [Arthrobacter antioxidans]|nr:hypothetical protein [Arthrobacter antioxidans]
MVFQAFGLGAALIVALLLESLIVWYVVAVPKKDRLRNKDEAEAQ